MEAWEHWRLGIFIRVRELEGRSIGKILGIREVGKTLESSGASSFCFVYRDRIGAGSK